MGDDAERQRAIDTMDAVEARVVRAEGRGVPGRSFVLPSAALARGAGWLVVGLANAVFVAALAPSSGLRERLLVQGADLSQFALFGCGALALYAVSAWARQRWALPRSALALTSLAAFAVVGHVGLDTDLANLLERFKVPDWFPALGFAGAALGVVYLVYGFVLDKASRMPRSAFLVLVVLLTALNNLALSADYPAAHLFVSMLAARAAAVFIPRLVSWQPLRPPFALAGAASLGLLGVSAFAFAAAPSAMKPLLTVPGSAGTPFLTRLSSAEEEAPEDDSEVAWFRTNHADWIRDRSRDAPIPPPSRAVVRGNPVVVLLTVDALRADVVSSRKHDAELPNLARLRDESVSFELARSPSPSTLTTLTSMFSGRYYSGLYWTVNGKSVLPSEDKTTRFPTLLSEKGVRTIHVIALRGLSAHNGVGVGFRVQRETSRDYGAAASVTDLLTEELGRIGDEPAFAYAHFIDPHAPYNSGKKKGSNFERYLSEIAVVDEQIGRLRAFIEERKLSERTILIVSADHGEAFGEHGMNYHARSVYEELLRVPLLVRVPNLGPRRVSTPVSLLDLGPTVLHLFGVPAPADMLGASLLPAFTGDRFEPRRPIAADAGRRIQALIYPDGVKAVRDIVHKTHEVYDLKTDPGELRDLSESQDFPARRYSAGLATFFDTHTFKKAGWEPPWRKF